MVVGTEARQIQPRIVDGGKHLRRVAATGIERVGDAEPEQGGVEMQRLADVLGEVMEVTESPDPERPRHQHATDVEFRAHDGSDSAGCGG